MLLRILSILVLIVTAVWLILYFRKNEGSWAALKSWCSEETKHLFSNNCLKDWKRSVFFAMLLVIVLSALTGFIPFLILGSPLAGFGLMLHVVLAPIFAVLATLVIISRAEAHRFVKNGVELMTGLYFWLFAISAIIVSSMVFSMYPIFGTIGQEKLLNIHRASSIILFVVVILFTLKRNIKAKTK